MAFDRPALADIVDRTQQDFVSRLQLAGAVLRRSVVYVLSRVLAGAAHMLYGFIAWVYRQLFADTAEEENLLRWGDLFGVERLQATFAAGAVTCTGVDGSVIPVGTTLIRADGAEFTTGAEVTIASGTAAPTVTAALAGADGNCDAGTTLTFESPVAGVDSTATAAGGLSGGADDEDLEDYRARVVERMRETPQGGANPDYEAWAREVAGVTRVWVTGNGLGPGTVLVRFMRDDDEDPIPDSGEVAAVQALLDSRKPVTATVTVAAPIADPLNPVLSITPDTPENRAAVQAELEDLLSRRAEPSTTLPISQIRTAIGDAAGVDDYVLTSPSADVTHTTGHIATLGTITWS